MISLYQYIREIPDFPKSGILFKDITPLLSNADALSQAVEGLVAPFRNQNISYVAGIESRGFILGALMAGALNAGFIPIRKSGKLPHAVFSASYALEYGTDVIEMHQDALPKGAKVLLHDDVLATGGTAAAALKLLENAQVNCVGATFLMELSFLNGRSALDCFTHSLLTYD